MPQLTAVSGDILAATIASRVQDQKLLKAEAAQMVKKLSYFSSVAALILLTIGISTSSPLFVSLGCVSALVGWALKS